MNAQEWYSQRLVRKELLEQLKDRECGVISKNGEIIRFMNTRSYAGLDFVTNNYLINEFGLYKSIASVRMPIINNKLPNEQQQKFKQNFWKDYFIGMDFPIDIDCGTISQAIVYAKKIEEFLTNNSWPFKMKFSGQRGFHYEVKNGIKYEEMRDLAIRIRETTLAKIDLNIYNFRQMWRCEWSMHQKSGLIAVPLNTVNEFKQEMTKPENAIKILLDKHYPGQKP